LIYFDRFGDFKAHNDCTEGPSLPEPEFQPGQQIEDYIIGQRLKRGGMGDLYLARDIVLKRKVIIKVLSLPFSQRQEYRNQFLKEARIQANLDNPHVVQVFRALVHKNFPCLVMQHVQGTDLEKIVKKAKSIREKREEKGALSVERAVHIFLQVLEGIGFAHKYNIVHGDIKPSNILLDQQGRVKIVDFGLSFVLASGKKVKGERLPGGTLQLMSPEQLLNEDVDLRSDIYSLGVTFFFMLTGQWPTGERKRLTDLLEYHMEESLDDPERVMDGVGTIRPRIKAAVLKALDKDQARRHQSCLEFSLAIKEDAPHELYSELLRLSLLATKEIIPAERIYLDRIARLKGLQPREAEALENRIRREMGLGKAPDRSL
jgi:serine/threonine protein kinase